MTNTRRKALPESDPKVGAFIDALNATGTWWNGMAAPKGATAKLKFRDWRDVLITTAILREMGATYSIRDGLKNGYNLTIRIY